MINPHSNTMDMLSGPKENRVMTIVMHLLFVVFLLGLVFSFRAVSSISTGLLLIVGIIKNRIEGKPWMASQWKNLFIFGCIAYFVIQLLSMIYTQDTQEGWRHIRIKTGIVIIPLAIACTGYLNDHTRKRLVSYYCLLLPIAALYCFVIAWMRYRQTGDTSLFFYHKLAAALEQHAVFFSILVFFGIVFLMEKAILNDWIYHRLLHVFIILILSAFLFLLSSKLVIPFYLLYITSWFIRLIVTKKNSRTIGVLLFLFLIAAVAAVLVSRNPVSERFREIAKGDPSLVKKTQFHPADYFNGLQFRMLQWRFVNEILSEENAWLKGVGVGDAQQLLDSQYISKNMYIGGPGIADKGYLSYHTHNQFLQAILQTGIPGLTAFIVIWISLFVWGFRNKTWETGSILALLIAWAFSDAVFESQYGVLIFTFFPLFVCLNRDSSKPGPST